MINIAFYFDIPGKGLLSGKQMWLAGKSPKIMVSGWENHL